MRILSIGLLLLLSACMQRYGNVPVEDATTNKKGKAKKGKVIKAAKKKKIDLKTAKVKVDENLTKVTKTKNVKKTKPSIPNSDLNAGAKNKNTSRSKGEIVKPLEVAVVDSKPANSLLAQANTAISAGNHAKAEVLLERALRITPRDPKLWYKMSQVKYARGDYRQAAAMAMRSNTMTSSRGMKKQNWRIIADSREKLGDLAGAEQARRYASK